MYELVDYIEVVLIVRFTCFHITPKFARLRSLYARDQTKAPRSLIVDAPNFLDEDQLLHTFVSLFVRCMFHLSARFNCSSDEK